MGELDPQQDALYSDRLQRLKRGTLLANAIVIGVFFYGLTATTHDATYVVTTALSAVFLLNICAYALKTALRPIPSPRISTPPSPVDPDSDTVLNEPSLTVDPTAVQEPFAEPSLADHHDSEGEAQPDSPPTASLVEVEEFPTHPPFGSGSETAPTLADQDTELDPDRAHLRNPDAPVITVPNAALRTPASSKVGDEA